jgi:hypothetical protein
VDQKRAIIWDLTTGQQVGEFTALTKPKYYDVAFSPCGRRIATAGSDVLLWDGTPLAETPAYQALPEQ